jgi:cell division septation protein DedD
MSEEGGGVDAKQIGFGLVGLGLGAAIIFIAGLQVGQQFDISALQLDHQAAETQAPKKASTKRGDASPKEAPADAKPSKKPKADKQEDEGGGLSFFRDLEEPDSGPKRLPTPEDEPSKDKTPAKSPKAPDAKPSVSSVKLAKSPDAKPTTPPTRVLKREGGGDPASSISQSQQGDFSIQIGTFADMEEASALVQELRADKQPAHIVLIDDPENGRRYRVNAGNLKDREAARALVQRLRARGLQATLSE